MNHIYLISGTVTFSSQANRDAALTRVNTTLSGNSYTNTACALFPAGVNTSGTTVITFSITVNTTIDDASSLGTSIYQSLTSSNRPTSGWVSVGVLI